MGSDPGGLGTRALAGAARCRSDVVLVHDAARPLAPSELVDAVAAAVLAGDGAVVPGLAITDTVKQVAMSTRPAAVAATEQVSTRSAQRSALRSDAPGFPPLLFCDTAHARPTADATDDAGHVERRAGPSSSSPARRTHSR